MTVLLIGHRGTGKTSLLNGLLRLDTGLRGADLDTEVELRSGRRVAQIIETEGLSAFRALERETLAALVQRGDLDVIAVGAGYPGRVPGGVECVWIRRDTDQDGRIFLDRPRLDPTADPLQEYLDRFKDRDHRYAGLADRIVTLPEGLRLALHDEAGRQAAAVCDYVLGRLQGLAAIITLLPVQPNSPCRLERRVAHLLSLGADVELRNDLLDDETIGQIVDEGPLARLLYSARRPGASIPPEVRRLDWDIALGPAPDRTTILSCHPPCDGTPEQVVAAGQRLVEAGASQAAAHLKLAPMVNSFPALHAGHEWAKEAPGSRSFLPISTDGRWAWYRLLQKGRTGVHYLREGLGSAPDQPTVLQWRLAPDGDGASNTAFAAFLGDPARHTRTPARHRDFFAARGHKVVAVRISEDEWPEAMPFLEALGLRAAAVSAPLKRHAFDWCDYLGAHSKRLRSVNTLHRRDGVWWGFNTDGRGLDHALAALPLDPSEGSVAVWGGGGVEGVLREALPNATFYSARTGELRVGTPVHASPELVVYASGRRGAALPDQWRPSCIFDLDYRENTPGRAYALRVGAHYVSGITMFEAQAAVQQRLWAEEDLGT